MWSSGSTYICHLNLLPFNNNRQKDQAQQLQLHLMANGCITFRTTIYLLLILTVNQLD